MAIDRNRALDQFQSNQEAYDNEIRLLAEHQLLPDCLPIYEIAVLLGVNHEAFRRVIEKTDLELYSARSVMRKMKPV